MQKKFSISLNYLQPLNDRVLEHFSHNLSIIRYDDERGYGFKDVLLNPGHLSAILVKRTPIIIPGYDNENSQIVRRETFLFSEIAFALDGTLGLLEVFGTIKEVPKVKSALRPLFESNTRLYSADLSPVKVIPKLLNTFVNFQIEHLTVNNFKYQEGIVGCYEMKLAASRIALDIIDFYSYDVIQASISIASDEYGNAYLKLFDAGRLSIQCEEDQFNQLYGHLKYVMFKGE
jgi:hypothetical protein